MLATKERACSHYCEGEGPRVVVSTAAFHARVWGSFPGLGGLKETKMFLPHPLVRIVGSLRERELVCSASDFQGLNFESCVWRAVSSHSSHHHHKVLQFSLYVHKSGIKSDWFLFPLLWKTSGRQGFFSRALRGRAFPYLTNADV